MLRRAAALCAAVLIPAAGASAAGTTWDKNAGWLQEQIQARIADARYVEVPDCAHILPWEKPDVLREHVLDFLRARTPFAA